MRKAGTAFAEAEAEAADVASPGAARPTARRAAAPAAATPAKTGSPKAGPRDAGAAEAGAAEAASPGGGPAGGQSKAAAPPEGRAAKATAAGAASAAAGPRAIQAPAPPSVPPPPAVPPAPADESPPTLLLRAVTVPRRAAPHRLSARLVAPVVCLVLGAGLLSGAAAGAWITGDGDDPSATEAVYEDGRSLWRDVPVDRLFPAELAGEGAGPGGADRRWLRVGVAPDGDCDQALDPLLAEVLAAVGCHRLVRATYVDETETSVTTVGLLFTNAAESAMRQMKERFRTEGLAGRPDLMPRAYAPPGTVAEGFGDEQRYSWTVRVLAEMPVVVYAVTGFVDGRTATYPQPAAEATAEGEETTVALAGLGHDAEGIADRVQSGLHRAADEAGEAGGADGWEPR